MVERSTLTAATGPGGNAPGVTFRVRSVEVPLAIEAGTAAPIAVGGTPTVDFGDGTPARKSAALSLVSASPPSWRMAAVVFDSVGAGPEPSKQLAAPYPTKSSTPETGQVPVSGVAPATSATFPLVALIAMFPAASGAGSESEPPLPAAS